MLRQRASLTCQHAHTEQRLTAKLAIRGTSAAQALQGPYRRPYAPSYRWLAVRIGLPLSAPAESTRGWDIAALSGGCAGLAVDAAQGLGVFCRWCDDLRFAWTLSPWRNWKACTRACAGHFEGCCTWQTADCMRCWPLFPLQQHPGHVRPIEATVC